MICTQNFLYNSFINCMCNSPLIWASEDYCVVQPVLKEIYANLSAAYEESIGLYKQISVICRMSLHGGRRSRRHVPCSELMSSQPLVATSVSAFMFKTLFPHESIHLLLYLYHASQTVAPPSESRQRMCTG